MAFNDQLLICLIAESRESILPWIHVHNLPSECEPPSKLQISLHSCIDDIANKRSEPLDAEYQRILYSHLMGGGA